MEFILERFSILFDIVGWCMAKQFAELLSKVALVVETC
jgi:hypothetical protein